MGFNETKQTINQMMNDNYKDFITALVSIEKGINDKRALDVVYEDFMTNDNASLLHENFDYSIENLREQGQLKQSDGIEVDQDDLVNIVGNVVGDIEVVEHMGAESYVYTKCGNASVTIRIEGTTNLKVGEKAKIYLDANSLHVFDKDTTLRVI